MPSIDTKPSEGLSLLEDLKRHLSPVIMLVGIYVALQILKHSISPELFLEITRPIRFFG